MVDICLFFDSYPCQGALSGLRPLVFGRPQSSNATGSGIFLKPHFFTVTGSAFHHFCLPVNCFRQRRPVVFPEISPNRRIFIRYFRNRPTEIQAKKLFFSLMLRFLWPAAPDPATVRSFLILSEILLWRR
jgi:hypothetical protein